MIFNKLLGVKTKFRKGNENWRMRKLFDQERPVITVAQDGSGDFQKIEDALRIATELDGATIQIKQGTYYPAAESTAIGITIPSNTRIIGIGESSYIIMPNLSAAGSCIYLNGKENIILENLKIKENNSWAFGSYAGKSFIDLSGAELIKIENCSFEGSKNVNGATIELFLKVNGSTTQIIIKKNKIDVVVEDAEIGGVTGYSKISILENNWIIGFIMKQGIVGSHVIFSNNWVGSNDSGFTLIDSVVSNNNKMQAMQFIDTQRTSIKGNCAYTIDMAATTSYNNVIGNILDVAVSNLGTGNTVANNTIY